MAEFGRKGTPPPPRPVTHPPFEARNSRWRLALLALLALGFVAAGLWLIGAFGPDHPTGVKATVFGWLSILFFGACGIVVLFRMRDTDVVLRVDAHGIWWKQLSDSIIPWHEIAEVGIVTMHRQKMLGLMVADPARYRGRTLQGRLSGANQALTGYPICLTVTGTDRAFAELVAAVEQHMLGR